MPKFVIEDAVHADWHGKFSSFEDAMAELKKRAELPWNELPNVAPCTSWQTCGRSYEIIEYDDSESLWKELGRVFVLKVSASGAKWQEFSHFPSFG